MGYAYEHDSRGEEGLASRRRGGRETKPAATKRRDGGTKGKDADSYGASARRRKPCTGDTVCAPYWRPRGRQHAPAGSDSGESDKWQSVPYSADASFDDTPSPSTDVGSETLSFCTGTPETPPRPPSVDACAGVPLISEVAHVGLHDTFAAPVQATQTRIPLPCHEPSRTVEGPYVKADAQPTRPSPPKVPPPPVRIEKPLQQFAPESRPRPGCDDLPTVQAVQPVTPYVVPADADSVEAKALVEGVRNVLAHMAIIASGPQRMTVFHCRLLPSVKFNDYFSRIRNCMCCSSTCYLLALVYVDRMLKRCPDMVFSPLSCHRLTITSMVVAAKFHDDVFYSNKFYAKVGGLTVTELNSLEKRFLEMLDWRLTVSPEEYARVGTLVQRALAPPLGE